MKKRPGLNLYNGDASNCHHEQVPEVGVNSEASGDDVEYGVGKNSGGRNSEENVAEEWLILAVELHLLNPEKRKRKWSNLKSHDFVS